MAKQNKIYHQKLEIKDRLYPYDPTEPVTLIAYGYKRNRKHGIFTTIDAVDQIQLIVVEVISGDEEITIQYKDGQKECHSGSDCRIMSFYDGTEIYSTPFAIDAFIKEHLYK